MKVIVDDFQFLHARLHGRTQSWGTVPSCERLDLATDWAGTGGTRYRLSAPIYRQFHGQHLVWQQYVFVWVCGGSDLGISCLAAESELKGLYPTTSFIGLALLLLSAMAWLAGSVADVQEVQQFALVGLIDALVWTFLGTKAVRLLRFALLFLFFLFLPGKALLVRFSSSRQRSR